ncbi:MAG: DPP IV N-terminal domain-containing protein [Phycisphaerae bacterium]|nr:DPP IV N-terminal domain-containing protein [Phycisphaerae bacterium]
MFTVKDFESKGFGPIRWLEDGSGYTTLEEAAGYDDKAKDIVKNDPATGDSKILISASSLIPTSQTKPLEIKDYKWSDDGTKLLVYTNSVRVWRQETRGDYWLYEIASGRLKQLGAGTEESMMMFAKFSPDGKSVGYVYKRDIYVQNLKTMRVKRLTRTGSDTIINGTSDWVYEEEFGLRDGFSFSPDGKYIAYFNFDSSGVKEFQLINYTDSEDRYPTIMSYQYPKVGTTNSAVKVGVVSVKGGRTKWLDTNDDLRNNYIPKMSWIPDTNKVVLQRMNRLQNTNKLMVSEISSGFLGGVNATPLKTIITEKDDAWIDIHDDMKWFDKGSSFTWTSERDGWRHMYMISGDGQDTKLLTPVEYDVISVQKIDGKGGWVYYIASPDDATQKYLYRTTMDGSGKTERLTPANQPGSHSYNISKDARWAIHTYSSYKSPTMIEMVDLPGHAVARVLEDNKELREKVSALKIGFKEPFKIDIGEGVELDGWCIKPSHFDPQKKYPLFVYVYGEPAAQTVRDSWGGGKDLWNSMIAEQGYIVVSIDNRGTPAPKGRAWRKSIYGQIGILASKDQAAAVKKITTTWPFIDADRVGVWGWSGGGSMTLNAMFRYPELYHTGIAVAFIANQRNYDTIYQERFMGLPETNKEGFKNGSPITFAENLKGNLLIVYGTGDDNCHFQNCLMLINELVEHNKTFSMMAYPNRTHAIKEGPGTTRHLYGLFTKYLNDNLPAGGK